jgi:hypothetical protein
MIGLPIEKFRLFCRATEHADNQQRHPAQLIVRVNRQYRFSPLIKD